jgi:rod shape-determining protein MreD
LTIAFFALLAVWLQTSVLAAFPVMGTYPDLLLAVVVFLGLYSDEDAWPLRYWLIGLLKDVLSAGALGVYATTFTAVGLLASLARSEVFRDHLATRAGLVFLAVLLANGTVAVAESLILGPFRPFDLLLRVLAEATYSAALAPVLMSFTGLFRIPLGIPPSRDLSRAV